MAENSHTSSTATPQKPDVLIIGAGWAGSIMAKELTEAGLSVTMLERGKDHSTAIEGTYPKSIDELRGAVRKRLFQKLAHSSLTIRNKPDQVALPYRQLAAFLPGEGVGGAGLHWSGCHFRATEDDLRLRSNTIERYGKTFIPKDMHLQDYGVTYQELEPFFDKAEKIFGTSGQAYTVNGRIVGQGNVFAPDRSDHFPLPAMEDTYSASLFRKAAAKVGYNPYSIPAANASQPYTNPYGCQMGPCNFCGYCSGYACYLYSKASPNVNILPALRQNPRFKLITQANVLEILLNGDRKKATGVRYVNTQTLTEHTLTADLVILTAFQLHNVHLLLTSGIGQPYNPADQSGTVGRNFFYQTITSSRVWLPKNTFSNQFVGAGGAGVAIDDFNQPGFDRGPAGFIGGSPLWVNQAGVKPITAAIGAGGKGKARWGHTYKTEMIEQYQHSLSIEAHGSNMSYRDVYLDLDPTWRNAYGQPMLRMTFTWKDNDIRMNQYVVNKLQDIANEMGATRTQLNSLQYGQAFDSRIYQTTHLGGGAVMGDNPTTSVVNRYLQSWDVSNLFVIGSSAFPQGMGYNPTGLVAALAYWSAHHIRTSYLANPGPMVQA